MTSTKRYTTKTPVDEPIEVRLAFIRTDGVDLNRPMTYLGSVTDNGCIVHSLASSTGTPESLSNLQPKAGYYPRKAVPGWQAEMLTYLASGLYTIAEAR